MHKVRTPWPVATRISFIVAFEEACRRYPGISARRFCAVADVPYSTFARWWAHWQREGNQALGDRPRRPRRCPTALQGQVLDVIRHAHRQLGWGVRRLYAYLKQAALIRCSLSSVYRVLRRCGALVRRPRKPKPIWIRYARAIPGERAQMDLKYLPHDRYQLTLVDDCSPAPRAGLWCGGRGSPSPSGSATPRPSQVNEPRWTSCTFLRAATSSPWWTTAAASWRPPS